MRFVTGRSSGKWLCIMCVSSCRETLLNIFVKSANTAARVGVFEFCCGSWMYFSTDKDIALIIKSIPPLMPTAKLKGRRYCANLSFMVMAMCVASRRRMAVGIPMGRSFRRSFWSLWRQNRYVSVKNCRASCGISPR